MSNSTRAIELNKSCDNQVIELNKIYNGDCLEVMDKLIAKGVVVNAIICDLPYIDYPEILGVKLYFRFRLKERTVCVCELDKI